MCISNPSSSNKNECILLRVDCTSIKLTLRSIRRTRTLLSDKLHFLGNGTRQGEHAGWSNQSRVQASLMMVRSDSLAHPPHSLPTTHHEKDTPATSGLLAIILWPWGKPVWERSQQVEEGRPENSRETGSEPAQTVCCRTLQFHKTHIPYAHASLYWIAHHLQNIPSRDLIKT